MPLWSMGTLYTQVYGVFLCIEYIYICIFINHFHAPVVYGDFWDASLWRLLMQGIYSYLLTISMPLWSMETFCMQVYGDFLCMEYIHICIFIDHFHAPVVYGDFLYMQVYGGFLYMETYGEKQKIAITRPNFIVSQNKLTCICMA